MNGHPQHERLFELLADRALVGLAPAEDGELAQLLAAFPDAELMARDIELAAAAVAIAGASAQGMEHLPSSLAQRIAEAAQAGIPTTLHRTPDLRGPDTVRSSPPAAVRPGDSPAVMKQTMQMPWAAPTAPAPFEPPQMPVHPSVHSMHAPQSYAGASVPPPPYSQHPPHPLAPVIPLRAAARPEKLRSGASRAVAISGWLAAAACLALAVGAWYFRPRTQIVTVNVPTPPPSVTVAPPPTPTPTPSPQQKREGLLARAGTARLEWSKNPKDPASKQASGDVVWNAAEQRGFMRFRGLAKNDKRANVYQLWIFDKSRDDKYPVDGGVFTIDDDSGDVIVPIEARLPVGEAALFAVTVEKPGGVVVSKRERIVVTAKPAT